MLKLFGFLILCFTIAVHAIEADDDVDDFELPPGIITCQIDSPQRDECIKEAIQDMLPKLKDGLPSLNIQPLEPYVVDERQVSLKRGSDLFAVGKIKNFRIYGITGVKISEVRTNINETHMQTRINIAARDAYMEGYYHGEVRFNDFQLKSKGYFNITANDATAYGRMTGVFIEKDGKRYLKITNLDVSPTIGDTKVFATGILPDPEMNRFVVALINQYWSYLYKTVIAETKDVWEPVFVRDINKFLLHVPIGKLLY